MNEKFFTAIERVLSSVITEEANQEVFYFETLLTVIEGSEAQLSQRFLDIAHGPLGSDTTSRVATAKRLLGVLEGERIKASIGLGPSPSPELLPTFQLNSDEKARLLELAADIRKIITASPNFDQPHKVRLLNRVAAMENEVYKDRGLFDVFLGGLNDFGETAGKFGSDVKPLTDRVQEMVSIARKNTSEYDALASPEEQQSLPHPGDFEK